MALLWTYANQQAIKPISANQAQGMFNQLAAEVQVVDLQNLIGFSFYQDLVQNPATIPNAALLDGGSYTAGGVTYIYSGLKYVLAYFFYARYILVSFKKDTYGGMVSKKFEDSFQLNNGDEANLAKDNRITAFKYWEECQAFIRENSSDYPYYCEDPNLVNRCNPNSLINLRCF